MVQYNYNKITFIKVNYAFSEEKFKYLYLEDPPSQSESVSHPETYWLRDRG